MQKALELMNIKIHTVIRDLLGKTGMRMLKAILAGGRNPEILCTLCDPRIKASHEDIIKSLQGIWKEEYLFVLEQALENYEFLQKQIKSCEEKIQQQLLKQIAISCLITNKTAIGDYYRAKRARLGGKGAALATAHKLSRIIYTMLLKKTEYYSEMIVKNQGRKNKKTGKTISTLKTS